MKKHWYLILLCIAIAACSEDPPSGIADDDEPADKTIAMLAVVLPVDSLTSFRQTAEIDAVGYAEDGEEIVLTGAEWSSSDETVLAVFKHSGPTAKATIQALSNGRVSLSVSAEGLSATTEFVVEQRVANIIARDPTSVKDLELPGDTYQLSVFIADARGNEMTLPTVAWSSSNPAVATVDDGGNVTATGFGRATIVAEGGGAKDTAEIEVVGDRFFLSGETRLRYALDKPSTPGPWPALIWAHGSGEMTRNTQKGATDPLVPEGMAVLRFDKRGVGESTGTYTGVSAFNSGTTINVLAQDVASGIRFLRRLENIDTTRIGIAGNSQGGWIAPLATTKIEDVSFLMLWSGPTVSVGLEIFYSGLADGTSTPLDTVYPQLSGFSGNAGYDPESVLSQMRIPSLWSWGELDRSIPTRLDIANADRYRSSGLPFDYIVYPNAGHDLRNPATGLFYPVQQDWIDWLRNLGIL